MAIQGNCAAMEILQQAGVKDADLLIAATSADEVNLLCCTTAHGMNPKLHTIARIRNPEYNSQIYKLRNIFGLSMPINPERQAATEIERLLKFPGFLRRDVFAKGRTEIVELRIDAKSKLLGTQLMDLPGIVKCRVLICAVLRGGHALVPNSGSFTFQEGDRVFVTAPTKDLTTLLKNLGIITRRVAIVCSAAAAAFAFIWPQHWKRAAFLSPLWKRIMTVAGSSPSSSPTPPSSTETQATRLCWKVKVWQNLMPSSR